MANDRFLIAPFKEDSGLTTDLRPWQIPDQAFAQLNNAYVFRGRVRKRFGSRYTGPGSSPLNSRLGILIGTTDGSGDLAFTALPGNVLNPGSAFSAGNFVFTVTNVPLVVGNDLTLSTDQSATAIGTVRLDSTGPNVYKFRISGANISIITTPVYWYPATPVMGFAQYEYANTTSGSNINSLPSFAYDLQFAYTFNGMIWVLSNGSPTWHGNDDNFFWSTNWIQPNVGLTGLVYAMFTTNYQVTNFNGAGTITDDPIYYWNGTTWNFYTGYFNAGNTANTGFLNPGAGNAPGTGPFLLTALMIFPFHKRLVVLSPIENDGTGNGTTTFGNNIQYPQRARWTAQGSPFAVAAWYPLGAQDNAGGIGTTANFSDAATGESIVSAEFIKDRLIVYFEESTWELVWTANEQNPFVWQKLNTELGSMATFSTIAFDKAILTIGETGIHSCNGSNVVRIDDKIPDQIFEISNPKNEVARICGIRDYYNELVYWAVPEDNQIASQPYPEKILVYNYQNKTWAYNDDAVTAFGYFDGNPGLQWQNITGTWAQWTAPWNSSATANSVRQIICGNQDGFVFLIEPESTVSTRNAGVLQITTMANSAPGIVMVIYNHMLQIDDYILVENAVFSLGGGIIGFGIYQVIAVTNQNQITVAYPAEVFAAYQYTSTFNGTYLGGGTAARVSNYSILSKQWNPYDKDGSNVYVSKIDFAVIRTAQTAFSTPGGNYNVGGAVTVDYSPSSSSISTLQTASQKSITGTGILETTPYPANIYPLEQTQNRLWHPVYFQSDGECIQINIYMSPLQICTPYTSLVDFEIEGIVLNTQKTSSRLQ